MDAQYQSTVRTLWMACLVLLVVVAGFALTYLVYGRLGAHASAPVEVIGELWDGAL